MQDFRSCIQFLNDELGNVLVSSSTSTKLQRVDKLTRYLTEQLGLQLGYT